MKIKSFIFTLAMLVLLGCTVIAQNDCPEYKPAEGTRLSSILYELAISRHPESFAKEHGIVLYENNVRVFIHFDPAASSSETSTVIKSHRGIVEKQSNDLLRIRLPVEELIPLSKEPNIWGIHLPDRPMP